MKKSLKMRWLWAILALIISFTGCATKEEAAREKLLFDNNETAFIDTVLSAVETVGNFSYIPINISARPSEQSRLILKILEAFENKNPQWEIIHWQIQEQQWTTFDRFCTLGIWVDHRPCQQ